MKQRQENESWGWLYALFILCSVFMVGRIGYAFGYKAKSERPPWPMGAWVYSDEIQRPAQPEDGELYFDGHGNVLMYWRGVWHYADVVAQEREP